MQKNDLIIHIINRSVSLIGRRITCDFSAVSFADVAAPVSVEQTIVCTVSGLSANTPISWIDPDDNEISDSDSSNYVVDQGAYVFGSKASTLTIKQTVLAALPSSSVFKCKLKSSAYSSYSPEVVKEMTLTLLQLGMKTSIRIAFLVVSIFMTLILHQSVHFLLTSL